MNKISRKLILSALLFLPVFLNPATLRADSGTVGAQDLWSRWRDGFEKYEAAEVAAAEGKNSEAIALYGLSKSIFENVSRQNPQWNSSVIRYRIDLCSRRITALKSNRGEPRRVVVTSRSNAKSEMLRQLQEKLASARAEIVTLKQSIALNRNAAEQVKSMLREKQEMERKNSALTLMLENAKFKLQKAGNSVELDERIVSEKNKVIALSREINNLHLELKTLRLQKGDALSKCGALETKLKAAEGKLAQVNATATILQANRREIEVLKERLDAMTNDRDSMKKSLADASNQLNALQRTVERYRNGTELPPTLRKLEDESAVLRKDNQYLRELKNKQESDLAEAGSNLKKAVAAQTALNVALAKTAAERDRKSAELSGLLGQFNRNKLELEKAASGLKAAVQERDVLKAELAAYAGKYETLRKNSDQAVRVSVELDKKDAQIKAAEAKIAILEKNMTALKKESSDLRKSVETQTANLKKAGESAEKIRLESAAKLKAEISKKNAELLAKQKEIDAAKTAVSEWNKKYQAELLQKQKNTGSGDAALNNLKKQFAADCEELQKIVVSKNKELELAKNQIAELEKKWKTLSADHSKATDELRNRLKRQTEEREKTIAANTENLKKIQTEKSALETKFKTDLAVKTQELEAAKKAEEMLRTQFRDVSARFAKLTGEKQNAVLEMKKQVEELNVKLAKALENNAKESNADKAAVDALKKQFAEQNEKLKKELADKDSEVRETRKASAELASKLNAELARQKQRIEKSLARNQQSDQTRRQVLEKANREKEALLQQTDSLKKEKENLGRKNAELEKLISNLKAERNAGEDTAKLAATITELKEGKAQYENVIRRLNTLKEELAEENKRLKENLIAANAENNRLKLAAVKPKPQGELERRNIELQESASKFEKMYVKARDEREDFKKSRQELETRLAETTKLLETAKIRGERLREELNQWTSGGDAAENPVLKRKDEAIDALVEEGVELRKERSVLKSELFMARDEVRRLKTYNVNLVRRIRKARQEGRTVVEVKALPEPITPKAVEKTVGNGIVIVNETKMPELKQAEKKVVVDEAKYKEAMALAEEAMKTGDSSAALMNYWRAVDANPKSHQAHSGLAVIYLSRGEYESAAKAYAKSLELGAGANPAFEAKLKSKKSTKKE